MREVFPASREMKAKLMDRIVMMDSGTHAMQIIGVGSFDPEEGNVYLHMKSLSKVRPTRNGGHPVQYAGWFYEPHLQFRD